MLHFIDAFVKWRGQIEIPGIQHDFQLRVIFHRQRQIGHHIGGLRQRQRAPGPDAENSMFYRFELTAYRSGFPQTSTPCERNR